MRPLAEAVEAVEAVVDPSVTIAIWQLETGSERLREVARRDDIDVAVAAAALEARSRIEGHLLAVHALISAGTARESVLALLRRAAAILSESSPSA